jgi:hypothetical protein
LAAQSPYAVKGQRLTVEAQSHRPVSRVYGKFTESVTRITSGWRRATYVTAVDGRFLRIVIMAYKGMTRWIEEADARHVCESALYDRQIATPSPGRFRFRETILRISSMIGLGFIGPLRRRVVAG